MMLTGGAGATLAQPTSLTARESSMLESSKMLEIIKARTGKDLPNLKSSPAMQVRSTGAADV